MQQTYPGHCPWQAAHCESALEAKLAVADDYPGQEEHCQVWWRHSDQGKVPNLSVRRSSARGS